MVLGLGARIDHPALTRASAGRRPDLRRTVPSRHTGVAAGIGLILVVLAAPGADASTQALLGLDTPPVALADVYTTLFEHTLVKAPPGVLGNDLDADGDGLVASLRAATRHGSLDLSDDGSFRYEPDDGFSGIDTFTYAASDGQAASLPTLVTITVGLPPPSPTPTPKPTPGGTPTPVIVLPTLPPLSTLPPIIPTPTLRPTPAPSASPTPSSRPSTGPSASTSGGGGQGAGTTGGGGAAGADRGGTTTGLPSADEGTATGTGGQASTMIDIPILGTLSIPTDWLVPGFVLTVPGVLVLIAVIAQALGAVVWLPLVRRALHRPGDDQIRRRKRRDSLVS